MACQSIYSKLDNKLFKEGFICLFVCLDPVSTEGERVRLDRNSGGRDTALKGMRVPSRDVSSEVCRVGRREERGSGASGEEAAGRA